MILDGIRCHDAIVEDVNNVCLRQGLPDKIFIVDNGEGWISQSVQDTLRLLQNCSVAVPYYMAALYEV